MPIGYALEEATSTEVVAAYSAPPTSVEANDGSVAEWVVAGQFYLPLGVDSARLDVVGVVSDPALTMLVRLFDLTAVAALAGTEARVTSTTPVRALSGAVPLIGNRLYQIQVFCYGIAIALGPDKFGVLLSATISD